MSDERPDDGEAADPPPPIPTEPERAAKAALLGGVLGAVLAALGRRPREG